MATVSSVALPALGYGLQSAPRRTKVVVPFLPRISGVNRVTLAVRNSRRLRRRTGGGAMSATCSAASEIFRIAAIMNGLVLVGVAVGFVLLRVETALEESE